MVEEGGLERPDQEEKHPVNLQLVGAWLQPGIFSPAFDALHAWCVYLLGNDHFEPRFHLSMTFAPHSTVNLSFPISICNSI